MDELAGPLFFLALVAFGILLLVLSGKKQRIELLESDLNYAKRKTTELTENLQSAENEKRELTRTLNSDRLEFQQQKTVFNERSELFPWLATAFADLELYRGKVDAQHLFNKLHPAAKAAEKVREYSQRLSQETKLHRALRYRLLFLENSFPWIQDLTGDTLAEYIENLEALSTNVPDTQDESEDPVRNYLADAEYRNLSPAARNQLALDRWKKRRKSPWEIGRDYERYIGFELESDGYEVAYFGAVEGFDDLGRDLIAKKKGVTKIIQCKYWSSHKEIHEKHIFQLFGSVVEYIAREKMQSDSFDLFSRFEKFSDIQAELVTSTRLSMRAKEFSSILNVRVRELQPIGSYPMIKCNISKRGGERVYHLPFDQQYDRTRIEPHLGELYVSTTGEAEDRGFRRAFRWKSQQA
ncbi:hypothetical protein [Tabrizicola sp.]|uniref:hypothetical protein n=1 Tax=Tabrizicola sp. TaxID=2005166 RepID=UPI00286BBBA8|nr:hypothetical protein [Tabrizicola sp.]